MKTTVKTDTGRVTVQPLDHEGRVLLSMGMPGFFPGLALTPDQCGALIFGMEQALEVIDQRHRAALDSYRAKYDAKEEGVRCHGDGCAAGQLPCPSPKACGVTARGC